MTTPQTPSAMTDEEIIEFLAVEVMGWDKREIWKAKDHAAYALAIEYNRAMKVGDIETARRAKSGFEDIKMYHPNLKMRNYCPSPLWNPLTNWNHTWEIIEAMKKRKCCILLEWQKVVDWNVAILPNHVMAGLLAKNNGKVPEEAYMHEGDIGLQNTICLAALSAIRSLKKDD